MRNKPIYLAILLSLASQLVGCDSCASMQKATANDCKRVFDHGLDLECGNGLLSFTCKAGIRAKKEQSFISKCVNKFPMTAINCALEQNSQSGMLQCYKDSPKLKK